MLQPHQLKLPKEVEHVLKKHFDKPHIDGVVLLELA